LPERLERVHVRRRPRRQPRAAGDGRDVQLHLGRADAVGAPRRGRDARDGAGDPARPLRATPHRQGLDGRRGERRRAAMNFPSFGGYQEDLWPQAFADTDVELAPASATPNPAKVGSASVRIEGVVKQHGATTVLHGVELQIAPGEFFVLLGPSGSGKTTTLRILAGLESVSAGNVYMDGADVTTKEPGLRDVAMVFQSYALYPHMTVEQNIGFPLKMVGVGRDEIGRAVAGAAAKVGIGH